MNYKTSVNKGNKICVSRKINIKSKNKGRIRQLRLRASTTVPSEFKTISPVGHRVYVKSDAANITSAGGILLPSSAQRMPTTGEVVSVSDGCNLKKGDNILYGKYSGTEIIVQDITHVLIKEEDILGILLEPSNISKLEPLNDRILVKVSQSEDETAGGILLTTPTKEKPTFGKVLAVGPGKKNEDGKREAPNVKIGGTVLYSKYSGTEFDGPNDEQYIILKESDIMAQLE